MTCAKSNSSPTLETVINENHNLRQTIYDAIHGNITQEQLARAINYDKQLDKQFISAQWWFAPKIQRTTANKSGDNPRSEFEQRISIQAIKSIFANKQYWFDERKQDYAINIVGIRNQDTTTNIFNDWIWVCYWYRGHSVERLYNVTTDPGSYWLANKMGDATGTAILVPGQYRDTFQIRKHRGQYDALCQKWDTTVKVYRDGDKDGTLDFDAPIGTAEGINIHRADRVHKIFKIDAHSAGCQVFQDPSDFNDFMSICYKHRDTFGNSFTYTLLDQKDFE